MKMSAFGRIGKVNRYTKFSLKHKLPLYSHHLA